MMDYLLSFLEGIISFISPCLLPMLPVYALYFAGSHDKRESPGAARVLWNACAFVLGFTVVFLVLGAFAGALGSLLVRRQRLIQVLGGLVVVFFGLSYLGLLPFGKYWLAGLGARARVDVAGPLSAFLLGLVFSLTWTPCAGAFLGSALVLAAARSSALQGMGMLLCYSAGLGIPFVIAALLIHQGKTGFLLLQRHLPLITKLSGGFLIIMGLLMAGGYLNALLVRLS
jgi:cytochrome c-type biogenesis protein